MSLKFFVEEIKKINKNLTVKQKKQKKYTGTLEKCYMRISHTHTA